MTRAFIRGAFDDLRFADFRFFEEAARHGALHTSLWPDDHVERMTGRPPKLPLAEREYFLRAVRWVDKVEVGIQSINASPGDAYVAREGEDIPPELDSIGVLRHVVAYAALQEVPTFAPLATVPDTGRPRVIVTGCFDWFHTGHVRFFEECAGLGELYVCVGHDANIRSLKGPHHPLFPATQRRYIAGAIRYATAATITSGDGWMDAAPEIERIRPAIYAVNEDGDRPEKRAFCASHGIEYRVLHRAPKEGLPRRQSTALRGF